MSQSNQVIGYRAKSGEQFVHTDFNTTWVSYEEPAPVSHADAYRRLAAFVTDHPEESRFGLTVVPAYRVYTPLETASQELGSMLASLCGRHGLNLGMTKEQIEHKIAQELSELGASHVADQINRLVGR